MARSPANVRTNNTDRSATIGTPRLFPPIHRPPAASLRSPLPSPCPSRRDAENRGNARRMYRQQEKAGDSANFIDYRIRGFPRRYSGLCRSQGEQPFAQRASSPSCAGESDRAIAFFKLVKRVGWPGLEPLRRNPGNPRAADVPGLPFGPAPATPASIRRKPWGERRTGSPSYNEVPLTRSRLPNAHPPASRRQRTLVRTGAPTGRLHQAGGGSPRDPHVDRVRVCRSRPRCHIVRPPPPV
jgi:hypothetical protein